MAKEHWFFIGGIFAVLVPLLLVAVIKKLDLLEPGPDITASYTSVNGRDLALHIFLATTPDNDKGNPALILFHGGGWRFGGPRQFYPQCQFFAGKGITCISAEYRLGPVNLPDIAGGIKDAGDAFDYVRNHAHELNVDVTKIFAGGGSSGGHLAAAIGLGLQGADRARPAGLILYNPVLDLSPCAPAHYLAGENWEAISPQHQVNKKLPPTLILSGEKDREVPPDMVNAFCDSVREAGGICEKEEYAGQAHGFFNPRDGGNPWFDKSNQRALLFLSGKK